MRVLLYVFPRPHVPNPEGEKLLERAKRTIDISFVSLRKGNFFELDIETSDPARARAIATTAAAKLLANNIVEEFEVVIPN